MVEVELALGVLVVAVDKSSLVFVLKSSVSPVVNPMDADEVGDDDDFEAVESEFVVRNVMERSDESLGNTDEEDDGRVEERVGSGGDPVIMGMYSIHAGMGIPITCRCLHPPSLQACLAIRPGPSLRRRFLLR